MDERLNTLTSHLAAVMIIYSMLNQFVPPQLREIINKLIFTIKSHFYPYVDFIIEEYTIERVSRHELYDATKAYLSERCAKNAIFCTVELGKDSGRFLTSIGDNVTVTDDFCGARVWWYAFMHDRGGGINNNNNNNNGSELQFVSEERRYYQLKFHKHHRNLIEQAYLQHVLERGRAILVCNRQRRLFTNNLNGYYYGRKSLWTHVPFHHPSTFETLAIDPTKKQDILNDLIGFKKGKHYYTKTGKAWKRGYLLYGPPGTGKSSMIAAIANYMEYDVYDLELTAVQSNTDLRKLLIETTNKSIIVIEDIDCSLDLSGKRESATKKKKNKETEEVMEYKKVTLSGLLNFTDGLWSVCGEERIIIFTTNHVEDLDKALIRAGRMDKHIKMWYCDFEAFKVLAKNYASVDDHHLFEVIQILLEKVCITPADVAECLTGMGSTKEDVDSCLNKLIGVLEVKFDEKEEEKAIEESGSDTLSIEREENDV
ncbi:hypothetical protein LUZ60_014433 [Juncus effusus]|nr:hypothetical protein LUZ60_014433 [Juncus effusus]